MKGAKEMRGRIQTIASQFPKRVADAQYAEAEIEMMESKKRCPVSPTPAPRGVVPGTLRASGTVHPPIIDAQKITTILSYGGPGSGAEDYAVVQHENLDFHHTTGQAKYLESVLNESRPYMAQRLGSRLHFDRTKF